jgi:murein DD-endopeptidase MepM/ murein hydrolase activator NlpD
LFLQLILRGRDCSFFLTCCVFYTSLIPGFTLIKQIIAIGQVFSSTAARWIKQHPKRVTATVAALLLSGGGGAFAVASLGPDAADLPVREILETVQPLAYSDYSREAESAYVLYRTDSTRSNDTADTLLKRLGIDDAQAAAYLRSDGNARQILLGRSGRQVTAEALSDQRLNKLTARWTADNEGHFQRLVIERTGNGFTTRLETAALRASSQLASGTIQSSLFVATDEAKIPDAVAVQLAEIFSGDIDFRRELRKGDRFSVVYETLEGDGEPLRTGRVLSAEFVNAGKSHQAMWFDEPAAGQSGDSLQAGNPSSKGGYYTLDGQSLRRAFLSSPVAFSRVSSGFAMRFHPVLKQMRAHLGTDFAASTGTPARTVGDGVVTFAGVQNGYGNVVFIKHRGETETVYAHLSKLLVSRGDKVSQGQTIGLVGSTGWATGPHLHFEVRHNGVQQDPMKVAQKSETVPVTAARKPVFDQMAQQARVALAAAASMEVTSAQ